MLSFCILIYVLFIYPEFSESDFVTNFSEKSSIIEQLNNMFPPIGNRPTWDKHGVYQSHRLLVFCQTKNQLLNIHVKTQLGKVLKRKDYVMPRIPVFYVISRDSPFLSTFLKKKSSKLLHQTKT